MRVGDFSVEVLPHQEGRVRETESGHVLARPGQVYRLRLRNHGPLRAVVRIDIDGRSVTDSGLVLRPWSATELERPLRDGEHGRFTVIAEGNEGVFGPDGGRDNEALGVITAAFRRELPPPVLREHDLLDDAISFDRLAGRPFDAGSSRRPSRFSRELSPPTNMVGAGAPSLDRIPVRERRIFEEEIQSAAGTGLSGHSDQEFVPIHMGPLEDEATIVTLRIVIASEEAIGEKTTRPLHAQHVPERPAARP